MKYVFYALLCLMFTGCSSCDRYAFYYFSGCSDEEIEHWDPEALAAANPFAMYLSFNGFDLNIGKPSSDGSAVNSSSYNLDYSLDFGFKYFLDHRNALRIGGNLLVYTNGKDSARNKETSIGPYIGFEHHFPSSNHISPYAAVGVGFNSWSVTTPVGDIAHGGVPSPQATNTGDVTDQTSTLRILGMAGFDWYPFRVFAIGAEYSIGYTSISGSHTDASGTKADKPTQSIFGITGGGNVHLLVHF
jgi:hypothetical protein